MENRRIGSVIPRLYQHALRRKVKSPPDEDEQTNLSVNTILHDREMGLTQTKFIHKILFSLVLNIRMYIDKICVKNFLIFNYL